MFARDLTPPYFAVMFASKLAHAEGYPEMAERMTRLAESQPGYLGIESARGEDGFGLTISYWDSEEAIRNWKQHADHLQAQAEGQSRFYDHYELRVARVERAYSGPNGRMLNDKGTSNV